MFFAPKNHFLKMAVSEIFASVFSTHRVGLSISQVGQAKFGVGQGKFSAKMGKNEKAIFLFLAIPYKI